MDANYITSKWQRQGKQLREKTNDVSSKEIQHTRQENACMCPALYELCMFYEFAKQHSTVNIVSKQMEGPRDYQKETKRREDTEH